MKNLILIFFLLFTLDIIAQNFTTTESFINFIEGEWEKNDVPSLVNLNSSKYLRFKFERINGDNSNLNVSAKSNTSNQLYVSNFNCQAKSITIDNDSTHYYAYMNLHLANPNLNYRFDSISDTLVSLRVYAQWGENYSQFYLKKVSSIDTLVIGTSCYTSQLNTSKVSFGCNSDSIYTTIDYSKTYFIERSTLDSLEKGVFVERYSRQNSCDSIVVLTVNVLDSSMLDLNHYLLGEWEWIYYTSGWGALFADSLDYKLKMKIFDSDSFSIFPYSFYYNDQLVYCSDFYLLSNMRLLNHNPNSFLLDGYKYKIHLIDSVTFAMEELDVYDGPTHYFLKKSPFTHEIQIDTTCNLDEVGFDTIFGTACDSTMKIIQTVYDCPTNIFERHDEIVNVMPNPGKSYIRLLTDENIKQVLLFNANGQLQNTYFDTYLLDIAELNIGLYFLKIYSNDTIYFAKFIKEK